MLVRQILKTKGDAVASISPDALISEAATILARKKIGALVVLRDDGSVAGILSERDIVRSLGERGTDCLSEAVETLMTRDLVYASISATCQQILTRMTEGRFRHMPVVEDGKLIGIVSVGDVIKTRLEELSMENESMQGMIMGR